MSERYDFITVGGGIVGLQLSALLASDGGRVLLLEKNNHVGGRAFVLEKDGFIIDNGIHLIRYGPKSATAKVFRKIKRELKFVDIGKSYFMDEDGSIKLFPTGPAGFIKTDMLSLKEKLSAIGMMLRIRKLSPEKWLDVSIQKWMDEMNIKKGLRKYFKLVSGSMLVCPFIEKSSAGELIRNVAKVLKAGKSVMYPERGWKYILNTLVDVINQTGEVRTGIKVEKIVIKNEKAIGVETSEGFFEGRNVICAVHPQFFLQGMIDEKVFSKEELTGLKNLRPTAGVSIDYCLSRKISDTKGLWYIWNPLSFGIFTSNLTPHLAPEGKSILTFFYPTAVEDMESPEKAKKRGDELERAISKLFPEINSVTEWKRVSHLKMVDGAEVNIEQYAEKRPGYKISKVENLFFAGDWTCAEGAGGDIGHESVIDCYRVITGKKL